MNANQLTVYLITQPYITDLWSRDALKNITIQRIAANDWLPLFNVTADDNSDQVCALKTMDSGELRSWYSLDVLMEWIRAEFEVYSVHVSLADVELLYREENHAC